MNARLLPPAWSSGPLERKGFYCGERVKEKYLQKQAGIQSKKPLGRCILNAFYTVKGNRSMSPQSTNTKHLEHTNTQLLTTGVCRRVRAYVQAPCKPSTHYCYTNSACAGTQCVAPKPATDASKYFSLLKRTLIRRIRTEHVSKANSGHQRDKTLFLEKQLYIFHCFLYDFHKAIHSNQLFFIFSFPLFSIDFQQYKH